MRKKKEYVNSFPFYMIDWYLAGGTSGCCSDARTAYRRYQDCCGRVVNRLTFPVCPELARVPSDPFACMPVRPPPQLIVGAVSPSAHCSHRALSRAGSGLSCRLPSGNDCRIENPQKSKSQQVARSCNCLASLLHTWVYYA